MKRITILLADDHAIVREGIRRILELDAGLLVVGEAQDGRQAVEAVRRLRPDVVLMDIAMPRLNGLEATRQVLKAMPATKVLILSAHSDEAYVNDAADAGAAGFLLKQTSADEVGRAIHAVHAGEHLFAPPAHPALEPRAGAAAGIRRTPPLTSREVEVLQLVAEGKANKEAAAELGIGIKTVEKHREHLMRKLGIHDTASLTRYAIGAGIIESRVQPTIR